MRIRGGATGVGRRTGWSQRRGGGAAFPPHQRMQQRGLLLVPHWVGGGVGGRRRGHPPTGAIWARVARRSARAQRASAMDTTDDRTRNNGRKIPMHPYLGRQMLDVGFRQTLKVQTLGCARRSFPYRSTSDRLVRSKLKTMNDTRDMRFIPVRATVVV